MTFGRHITPRRRCRLFPVFLATAMLAVVCTAGPDNAIADDAETLGEVRLTLTKQPPPPPAEQRPRVALLLIDCSSSMREAIGGQNSPRRWQEMRRNLEQTLRQLLAVSPGIEVRLRFFGTFLDCLGQGQATAKIVQAADIDVLMAKVPQDVPNKSECTTTSLYESTVTCVQELRRENEQRRFEWWMFGVFSDGKDGPDSDRRPRATTTEQERNSQLEAMKREGGQPLVWTVGPDAEKAAKTAYGPALVLKLGELIPNPPKPVTRFTLALASGQLPGVQIDHPAKAGRHKLLVNVAGDGPAGAGLIITPQVVGGSPFRIVSGELTVQPGVPNLVELDLPQDINRAQGASASFIFRASTSTSADALDFDGEPQVTFTYTADRTLPPDQWNLAHSPAERRGVKTLFAAAPGQASSPRWTFKGPNGAVEREDGLVVSHAFPAAGKWDCEFSCISESGAKLSRQADPIEIVDAAFAISPAQASIGMDEPATFRIVPVPSATSAANYECLLDGQEIPLGPDGKTITLPPGNIDQIGRHTLAVIAKSRIGSFDWRSDAAISVKASPRVGIMPTEFVEGRDTVPVTIQAAGDIGGAVTVFANGKAVDEYQVFYPSPDVQVAQVEAKIPTADITKPELDIAVRPKKEGACPEATATLRGRAADVHAALKSPASGTRVSEKGGRQIVLEPAGDNADDVGDIEFAVAFAAHGEAPQETGLLADKANRWTVAIPRQSHQGPTSIYAKPKGGRLRPDLFPKENDGWHEIGSIDVIPARQWVPLILSLLGIGGSLYFTWTALAGNEARYWRVQTRLDDPETNTLTGWRTGIPLRKGKKPNASNRRGDESLPAYGGWPLWNWFPRRPSGVLPLEWFQLESKDATMYLWQFAENHRGCKWLQKAITLTDPKRPIIVKGGGATFPISDLPDNKKGGRWPWIQTWPAALNAFAANGVEYSKTLKLTTRIDGEDHSIWIRVAQPKVWCFEHFALLSLLAMCLPLVAYLLIRFHFI